MTTLANTTPKKSENAETQAQFKIVEFSEGRRQLADSYIDWVKRWTSPSAR